MLQPIRWVLASALLLGTGLALSSYANDERTLVKGPRFGDWLTTVIVEPSGEVRRHITVLLEGDVGLFVLVSDLPRDAMGWRFYADR